MLDFVQHNNQSDVVVQSDRMNPNWSQQILAEKSTVNRNTRNTIYQGSDNGDDLYRRYIMRILLLLEFLSLFSNK